MPILPLTPCYGGYHRWGVKYAPAPPTPTTTIAHEVAATNQLKKKKGAGHWKHSGKPKTYPRGTDTSMCNRREGMAGSTNLGQPKSSFPFFSFSFFFCPQSAEVQLIRSVTHNIVAGGRYRPTLRQGSYVTTPDCACSYRGTHIRRRY